VIVFASDYQSLLEILRRPGSTNPNNAKPKAPEGLKDNQQTASSIDWLAPKKS
jgi:hypothetical protein